MYFRCGNNSWETPSHKTLVGGVIGVGRRFNPSAGACSVFCQGSSEEVLTAASHPVAVYYSNSASFDIV